MRILHTEASQGWGGQEIRILSEASGLIARGHDVHLACPYVHENRDKPHFTDYANYLKQFFHSEDVKNFIAQNPSLINDYSAFKDELEYIFSPE